VLKITTTRDNPTAVRVHLCGQFTGEYVPELQKALAVPDSETTTIAVDMTNVTFVDREAMMFLCDAKSMKVAIENIPSYVMRWIEQQCRCSETPEN
jgi:hypothetical protein